MNTETETLQHNATHLHKQTNKSPLSPTNAFVGASWVAFLVATVAYNIGLWNAEMELNEKGYYFSILILGLFTTVSVQKNVRDKLEGIAVSDIYYGISWVALLISVLLLIIGLWNADLLLSEKGFFGMSFLLALFAAVTVQKNVRDKNVVDELE